MTSRLLPNLIYWVRFWLMQKALRIYTRKNESCGLSNTKCFFKNLYFCMPICRQTYIIGKKFPFNYMCELLRSDLRFRGGKLRCDVLMRWLPQTCGGTDCRSQQRRWHTSMPCRWGGSTGAWPRMWRWFCECAGVITNSILCLCFTQLEAVPDYYGAMSLFLRIEIWGK